MKYNNISAANLFNGFSQFVERSMAEWDVPGLALSIVYDDMIIFQGGFGYRDVEKNLAVTSKTLFAIGSCTKSFTAMAIGMLVDEGKLEWNKPLIEYMPDFRLYDQYATLHVTPCDLLCHRTGIPRYDIFLLLSPLTRQQVCEKMRYLEPNAGFREVFQYNNLMYVVAGVLLERISSCTWEEFVYNRIFKPLGMEDSNFSIEKIGVVVLTNKFSMLPHIVTSKIYDRLLGLKDFDWNTHFSELFQKCAGACNLGAGKKDVKLKSNTQLSLPLDNYTGT